MNLRANKVGAARKVLKSYTFSDGTTVPKGTSLGVPITHIQLDDTIYANAFEFKGFRFSELRDTDGESAKHHSSNTNTGFMHFGHGHHAWYVISFCN